jgi:hypothetical protein
MKRRMKWGVLLAVVTAVGCARAESLSGSYVDETHASMTMTLTESANGAVSGSLTESGKSVPISAKRRGTDIRGTIGGADAGVAFTAVIQGVQVILEMGANDDAERMTFTRSVAALKPATVAGAVVVPPAGLPKSAASSQRHVVINDQRLGDAELAQIEQAYQIHVADADYWYDPVLGAWGLKRGPARGFISAGLNLGGPLRPDASGGGTLIFVNRRELHPYDVMALQQITGPIAPGRYFITALGLAGYEGGPVIWNLAAMAAQAQGGGGSNSWQGRVSGASGFSDGTTGAVFLPNGGISSVGQ